jgi:hypothetical protein
MAAALENKAGAPVTPSTDASFEPYGRLLRMLVPTLRGVVVHDGFANPIWSSDEWDLSDDLQIVKDTIANALSDGGEFAGISAPSMPTARCIPSPCAEATAANCSAS